jgi:hypothetical protein
MHTAQAGEEFERSMRCSVPGPAEGGEMTEPKKSPGDRTPRQLPEVLKGPAHRDRRKSKTTLHPEGEDNRRQPSLPLVKWLSRKYVS